MSNLTDISRLWLSHHPPSCLLPVSHPAVPTQEQGQGWAQITPNMAMAFQHHMCRRREPAATCGPGQRSISSLPGWFAAAGLSHSAGSRDSQDPQRCPGSSGVSKHEMSIGLVYLTPRGHTHSSCSDAGGMRTESLPCLSLLRGRQKGRLVWHLSCSKPENLS